MGLGPRRVERVGRNAAGEDNGLGNRCCARGTAHKKIGVAGEAYAVLMDAMIGAGAVLMAAAVGMARKVAGVFA